MVATRLCCHFNRFAPVCGDARFKQQVFPIVKEFKPNPNPLQHIFHAQQGVLRIVAQFHPGHAIAAATASVPAMMRSGITR